MQTVMSNLLVLICVVTLTACGLKGPLYLPDENTVLDPASAQDSETDEDQKIEKAEETEDFGSNSPVFR
jgi:predicted small lipoprotein YifL